MSGSKTTQKTTSNQTVTPQNPSWVTGALEGYTGRVNDFANTDPRSLVAGPSALQQAAFGQAERALTQPGMPQVDYFGRAAQLGDQGAQSATSLIGDYMNPYQGQVIDASLADYDVDAGRQRAALSAAGARNKAFGGSRFGLAEAELGGELSRGRNGILSALLSSGFNSALGAGQEQRGRELSASSLFGQLGATQGSDQRANLGMLADLGGQQRDIDANYRTADLSMLQALGQLYQGGQYGLFQGQNQTGTSTGTEQTRPGLLGTVGQAASTGASLAALFSDARLKKNIRRTGERPDGIGTYRYSYIWDDEEHDGVMAHEVLKVRPDCVGSVGGFLTVDYGRLG